MNKSYSKLIFGACTVVFAACVSYVITLYTHRSVFVNTNDLYSKYEGKKELEKKFLASTEKQKSFIDSLSLDLKSLERQYLGSGEANKQQILVVYSQKKEYFDRVNTDFERVATSQREKYMDQIWTQLNQYIKDYGEKEGYDFVYGANGNGSLMFAKKSNDITEDMIEYANKRYSGK